LLTAALLFGLGAALGDGAEPSGIWSILGLAGLLILLAIASARPHVSAVALLAAAFATGAAAVATESLAYRRNPLRLWVAAAPDGELPVQVQGVAAADATAEQDPWVLLLDVHVVRSRGEALPIRGRVRILVGGESRGLEVAEGDAVRAWVRLSPPSNFRNPGGFDALDHARLKGVHAWGRCKSRRLLAIRQGAGPAGLPGAASAVRGWARRQFRAAVPAGPEQALLRAMVLGDRGGLDPETSEGFRIAGTYHVLAISGAQVALLAGLLVGALNRLRIGGVPLALLLAVALGFYAELVGGDVPVVRAAIVAIVMMVGRCWELDSDPANLLGLAAGLVLLTHPSAVGDIGFQLSFAASLGIVLLTPGLLGVAPRLPLRLEMALCVSAAAQAAVLPLLIWHFHRPAPAALIFNLAAVPLASLVLLLGIGVLAAAAIAPALVGVMSVVAFMAAHAMLRSGQVALAVPALDPRLPDPPLWAVLVWTAGLVAFAANRPRARVVALAGLGLGGLVSGREAPPGDGRLHLTVLDVGRGDCLVLRSPQGNVAMVDAGGSHSGRFDVGEAVVAPFLWSYGIRNIGTVVISHAHSDHLGGIPFLLRAFRVGQVWEGPAPGKDRLYEGANSALEAAGVSRRTVFRGVTSEWDGVGVEVLGPRPPPRATLRARNDDSVVLRLHLGEVTFLLPGDVEAEGQEVLTDCRATVLKVPHHGSPKSNSGAFVAAVAPTVAVVSVGGEGALPPDSEVVERYRRQGARLFRTDRDGAVTVSTDGKRLWVCTHVEGRTLRIR